MGTLTATYYTRAERIGGHLAKFRLALLTKMTSTQALTEPDTPDLCARFEEAIGLIEREFAEGRVRRTNTLRASASPNSPEQAPMLRSHIRAFLELMSQRALFFQDLPTAFARFTETAATTLNVARASIWILNGDKSVMRCADLFEATTAAHSDGITLKGTDFPTYFDTLCSERTIAAHDACLDLRTSEFAAPYLQPLGISSMLDVPIWVRGQMVGVFCHEHIGPQRTWTSDEESFAYLISNFAALAIERDPALLAPFCPPL